MGKGKKSFLDLNLQALVDGALSPAEQLWIMIRLANSPELQRQFKVLKEQKDLLRRWGAQQPKDKF